jgi:DNA-binding PadR family transcriptional regulator
MVRTTPATHLPLTEPTFYILLSLAKGAKHGYAVMQDVEGLSGTRISLSTSTLYSALRRLLDRGLIASVPPKPDQPPTPGLPRKLYALSRFGRQVMQADMRRLEERLQTARRLIGSDPV